MKTAWPPSPGRRLLVAVSGGALLSASLLCSAADSTATRPAQTRAKPGETRSSCCPGKAAQPEPKKAAPEKVVITGSHIPQRVNPADANRVSPSPVCVIDRKMIETSGASSLSGVLRKTVGGAR